jgi:OOP family OmpA-OmpF porin
VNKISNGGWNVSANVEGCEAMNEAEESQNRRYRQRLVGCGVFAFVLIFLVAAAIMIPNVQNELSTRVEAALVAEGVGGVEATFSGQDGRLRCGQLVADSSVVRRVASEVDGVRRIELDATCADAPAVDDEVLDSDVAQEAGETATTTIADDPDGASEPEQAPVVESVLRIIDRDPLFTTLAGLLESADLRDADGLDGPGPFTVLAPTDEAFDAAFDELGADAYRALVDDQDRLGTLLLHHVSVGSSPVNELSSGTLEMLDGAPVVVSVDRGSEPIDVEFVSGGSVAGVAEPRTQLDIVASNGMVHAVDRLLVPPGLDLTVEPEPPVIVAVLTGGDLSVSGTVQSDDQRSVLEVASSLVDDVVVVDDIAIDPAVSVSDDDVERFAAAIGVLNSLVVGEARLDDDDDDDDDDDGSRDVSVSGVADDAFSASFVEDFGADNDVIIDVVARTVADASTAQDLEGELNAFVAASPVQFEPESADLTPESNLIVAEVAERVIRLDGISLEVIGYTDSDGAAAINQTLSEDRANAVRFVLVLLGVDPDQVTARGLGETELVIVDGGEDPDASRRVEFVVSVSQQ